MRPRTIAVFTGNRAEYGLQLPILKAIDQHPELEYRLIVSGAHLDDNFGKTLDDKLTIACKDKAISILEIQKEGKGKQEIEKFLLGNKIKEGESIS